ncbi:thioredoxin domain-containing protein [Candidatus Kaiserbacteria bacterium]|nr:thioredoxin domain-containing protein [Candidatus Kaiserbacteria bacterium]USN91909.1 MAG: thioredoxin domain-containing protein [Candidatus Nomurabacteria bacterium]
MEPSSQDSSPAIPIAIICGFAMIALAIFFTNKDGNAPRQLSITQLESEGSSESDVSRPVDKTDYIKGNPNAPILIVEYSDYDCPFCGQYHNTLNQIMDEYGVTGKLAWVYRQFPLAELHPNSPKISEAALCVGNLGGNEAFWAFSDRIFTDRDSNELTNVTKLQQYAEEAGVSKSDYVSCVESGRMESVVESSIRDGFNSGARGTPYTVLIVGNKQAIINGAQSYDVVKGIIENLIEQLEGTVETETAVKSEVPLNEAGIPIIE